MEGTVKWFSEAKGYGFITPADGGPDIFFHFSAIQMDGYKKLAGGDRVEYRTKTTSKGPEAQDVRKV